MTKKNSKEPVSRGVLDVAVKTILEGMDNLFRDFREEMNAKFAKIDDRFNKVDEGFDRVEVELSAVKNEVKGIKAELSDTPSRREYERLKDRVDKYHPLT